MPKTAIFSEKIAKFSERLGLKPATYSIL